MILPPVLVSRALVVGFLMLTAFPLSVRGAAAPLSQSLPGDSARVWMASGRSWHAATRLRESISTSPPQDRESLLLLAEAEGGWGNWTAVGALLSTSLSDGTLDDPRAWYLLGRSFEADGRWAQADSAYGRALGPWSQGAEGAIQASEARLRRIRAKARAGRMEEAVEGLRTLPLGSSNAREWLALELAKEAAAEGSVNATLTLLTSVERREVRAYRWDLPALALLSAGDSAGAEAAFWSALPSLLPPDRARGWERIGALRVARGDPVGARAAFHRVLEEDATGGAALPAARHLLELGFDSADVALTGAGVLARAGDNRGAIRAYRALDSLLSGSPPPPVAQVGRARAYLAGGEAAEALEMLGPLAASDDPEVGTAALGLQVRALRTLGRGGEARRREDELVERFPDRPEAVEILFNRAVGLENGGDRSGALRGFRATAELSPAQSLAGEARMREGRLLMAMGRLAEAEEVFRAYLTAFPDGRRWDQAAFWAGRALLDRGQREEGEALLRELRVHSALSYYSVEAGRLLGEPYAPAIPIATEELPFPPFLRDGLRLVDELRAAGLEEGVIWEVSRLTRETRAMPDAEGRVETLLRLALELNQRGLTREGINLGWEVQRGGKPWDTLLLSSIYPFPYRDIVVEEARERGLDPYLVAGLIRQESAFWAQARSRADARGLMQVLPATGGELARSVGPRGFRADDHLFLPEINVHLGSAFLADLLRRFGSDLPLVLSAYNAGPSRALRWREFPEVTDLPRFVERIPFEETRGYVKAVTVNRAIYAWLYREPRPLTDEPAPGSLPLP